MGNAYQVGYHDDASLACTKAHNLKKCTMNLKGVGPVPKPMVERDISCANGL